MKRDTGKETEIRLGRGRPFSGEALRGLWRAVCARDAAADWTKGRLLTLVVTVGVLVWAAAGVLDAVEASGSAEDRLAVLLVDPATGVEDGNTQDVRPGRAGGGLRSDLFKAPQVRRTNTKKEPKTNPVELLGLIELQGVMGGSNPRAMVLYKRTNETVTVSVGDDLGEFEVMEIRDRSVVLKWRDELFELSL